jgi:hypothetical protein
MDIDGLRYFRETRWVNIELIRTKREVLHDQTALVVGVEDASVLVRLTDDLNRGFHSLTRWICHPEPQLTAVGLGKKKQGTRKE